MKRYTVAVTKSALSAITEQARYIAIERSEPLNAQRWLELIWDAISSLEVAPRRADLAAENAHTTCEVRRYLVGSHVLLFTIDEQGATVWILGLRHGGQLPRSGGRMTGPDAPV